MLDCNKADSYVNPPEFYCNDPHDYVPVEDGCPNCGERDTDQLEWQDDETVRCLSCGKEYMPGRKTEPPDLAPDDDCFMEERLFPSVLVEED